MNKLIITSILGVATALSVSAKDDIVVPDSTGFKFTDVKIIPSTPVKDQNKSGTCWCFSTNTFLENEILRKTGKEIDLSEMFVVRHCYGDKAKRFVRMDGQTQFAAGGSGLDVPYVWRNYGMMPEGAYSGLGYGEDKHDHGELDAVLRGMVTNINERKSKRLSTAWQKGIDGVLNAYMGELPETFEWEGKTYTPRSFADALGLDMNDYIPLTSFSHHPFYQPFMIEVADNWLGEKYFNLPLEELKAVVDNAIDNGYTIAWAADVSEGGFKWRNGYAVLPKPKDSKDMDGTELARWVQLSDKDRQDARFDIKGPVEEEKVTQESRQIMFDRKETTDDHGMVIVGRAVDQDGNKYYKVQNSWDTNQLYGGFFYVSEPYFLAKTIDILVNREAIPAAITKKLNLPKK